MMVSRLTIPVAETVLGEVYIRFLGVLKNNLGRVEAIVSADGTCLIVQDHESCFDKVSGPIRSCVGTVDTSPIVSWM